MSNVPTTLPLAQPGMSPAPNLPMNTNPAGLTPASTVEPATNLQAAANAAPKLDPSATVGIANTANSPLDAAIHAHFVNAFLGASKLADQIKEFAPAQQMKLWNAASDSTKALLSGAGYTPPSADQLPAQGGLWHDILNVGDIAKHDVYSGVDAVLKYNPLTVAWNVGANVVNHSMRAALYNSHQWALNNLAQGGSGEGLGGWFNMLNPHAFAQAWDATGNAPMSYDPLALRYVQQEMGVTGQTLQLAKMVASGMTLQQVLATFGANPNSNVNAKAQAYSLIQSSAHFGDAVKLLSDSHLTWGQAAFGGLSQRQIHVMFPQYNVKLGNVLQQGIGTGGTLAMLAASGGTGATEEGGVAAAGLLSRLGTAARIGAGTGVIAGSALGLAKGETADTATTMSPFGLQVHPLSGLADGVISWYLNPIQIGLANRAAMVARNSQAVVDAMGNPNEIEALYRNSSTYNRWAQKFSDAVTAPFRGPAGEAPTIDEHGLAVEPNFGNLRAAGIATDGLEQVIKSHYADIAEAIKTGDNAKIGAAVGRMIGDPLGEMNIAQGRMSYWYKDATQFPRQPLGQEVIDRVRGLGRATWGGEKFNMAKMSPTQALSQMIGDKAASELANASADYSEGRMARFMRRAVNLMPTGVIDVNDQHGVTQLERVLSYALPQDRISEILSYYQNTDPAIEGERMKIAYAAVLEMMRTAIDHDNPAALDWLKQQEDRYFFGYHAGGEIKNPLNPDGPPLNMAIIEPQLSHQIAVPNFTEMYRFAKKSWLMGKLNMGANNDLIDHFMSKAWKPMMLLRPGFAIRVAGEEMALFMLRSSPKKWLMGRIAGSLTDAFSTSAAEKAARAELQARALAGDEKAQATLDAQRVFKTMTSHIPESVRDGISTPKELIANIYGWRTLQWLQRNVERAGANGMDAARAVGRGLVGQDILDSAQFYLDHSDALQSSYAREVSAVTQHRDPYFGESANFHEGSMWKSPEGLPLQLVRDGTYKVRASDEPLFHEHYHMALSQLADSNWSKIAAGAYKRGGYNAQLQAVEDALRAKKLWNDLAIAAENGNGPEVTRITKALENHEALLRRFPRAFQTQDGYLTLGNEALQNQAFRDWARAIVDNVNHHTMTLAVQEEPGKVMALPAADEEGAAQHLNPRPIVMPNTQAPVSPFKVESIAKKGGADYEVSKTFDDSAYSHIPKGHLRLFTPVNVTDAGGYNPAENPGRFWTPSHQQAVNIAGVEGEVHQIDVPMKNLLRDFKVHGEDETAIANRAYSAQHIANKEPVRPPEAHFESGKIVYGTSEKNAPETLMDMISRGHVPDTTVLKQLPDEVLPDTVRTPDVMLKASDPSMWAKGVSKGFYHLVGRPLDWLSRQPISLWIYHNALQETRAILKARGIEDETGQLAHDIAEEKMISEVTRYIHDPRARSQFSGLVRNVAPFWFAQEQFYKRWGHLFGSYPEAWYKLSMTLHALRSVGFVYTDQYGKNAFNYPGSAAINDALMHLPFFQSLPVGVPFSTEVNALNPSMANGLLPIPSVGPMIVMPTDIAGWAYPKYFGGLAQFLQGPDAASINITDGRAQRLLDQILPTILTRLGEFGVTDATASTTSDAGSALFLTSMIDATRLLVSQGHGPTRAQQADPREMQKFETRVMHWTENMMLMRSLFGFVAPGTPNFGFNTAPNGLGAQLQALMATMPYNEAVAAFLKAHPDATAYDIFGTTTSSKNQSGAYVPATVEAGKWLSDNSAFVDAYPQLAPWAMPQQTANGLFSSPTYQQEINLGLRARRSLDSWVNDYYYSKGANTYYGLEQWFWAAGGAPSKVDAANAQQALGVTQAEAAQKLGVTNASESQIKEVWDKWKAGFLTANPLFASNYQDRGTQSLERRTSVVSALQDAIATGSLPKSEWSTHVEELMSVYDQVQSFYSQTQGNSAYATQRTQYKQAMNVIGTQMAKMYPDIAPIWNSVLSKQIGVVN